MKIALGGERLGSGKKEHVNLRTYNRSTHDLSHNFKTTMASGTLVPFFTEVALQDSVHEINLDVDVMTHPTIGPLFGSYKIQLDVFQIPIRLYQGKLHMNMLNIGRNMSNVELPQVLIKGKNLSQVTSEDIDNEQINPSSIFKYLDISGIGNSNEEGVPDVLREFQAVTWLGYWDIYKNYYANKQEDIGYVIHNDLTNNSEKISLINWVANGNITEIEHIPTTNDFSVANYENSQIKIFFSEPIENEFDTRLVAIRINGNLTPLNELFEVFTWDLERTVLTGSIRKNWNPFNPVELDIAGWIGNDTITDGIPRLQEFQLDEIDKMRLKLLKETDSVVIIDEYEQLEPYKYALKTKSGVDNIPYDYSIRYNMEGLGIKAYNSDLFNNWISTEWLDGENGVNEITKIQITDDSFTIDEFNLKSKIYEMLNRIAVSGGSYEDWLDVTYSTNRKRSVENPIYLGGMIRELAFQEVISNAESGNQPLGTLAGRGVLTGKRKGGRVKVKIDEPSFLIGIASLTPRLDYSQGNKWHNNLKTMDDFHKPALDGIGFQELITDQMAWFDTSIDENTRNITYKSAGKQPAWINYQTAVNRTKGNFAKKNDQMFMTLNRNYEVEYKEGLTNIKDLTTYIDPSKFNNIFADTRIDAQNFWMQIRLDYTVRNLMSARQIPNL